MDHRNLDKAMEIFACLITGETVGRGKPQRSL